jgi:hypothetical protein
MAGFADFGFPLGRSPSGRAFPPPVVFSQSAIWSHISGHLFLSGAALLMRLRQIGVIHEAVLTYAFQTVARGWRTQEPDELEPEAERGQRERPLRFERLCYRALAEDFVSLSKAAELLRITLPRVEAGLKGPQGQHADYHQ